MDPTIYRQEAVQAYQQQIGRGSTRRPNSINYPFWIWLLAGLTTAVIILVLSSVRVPLYLPIAVLSHDEDVVRLFATEDVLGQVEQGEYTLVTNDGQFPGTLRDMGNEGHLEIKLEAHPRMPIQPGDEHLYVGSKAVGEWLSAALLGSFDGKN